MQKSLLALYMQKVAEGDSSFLGRLCGQLADRLLVVPTQQQSKKGQAVKVSIARIAHSNGATIPVFTSEKKFREWAGAHAHIGDSISLLGADLCGALDGATAVWIDPESQPSVRLPADAVGAIAGSGEGSDYAERAVEAIESSKQFVNSVGASSMINFPTHSVAAPIAQTGAVEVSAAPREERSQAAPPRVSPPPHSAAPSMSQFPAQNLSGFAEGGAPRDEPLRPGASAPSASLMSAFPSLGGSAHEAQSGPATPSAPVSAPPQRDEGAASEHAAASQKSAAASKPPAPAQGAPLESPSWGGGSSLAGGALRGEPVSVPAADSGASSDGSSDKKRGLFGLFKKS